MNSITSITQLVYGAMLVHRKRRGTLRGGNYAPAVNPAVAVETGYGGAYVDPSPGYYQQSVPAAYGVAPAPQYYGETKPGSYELDSRVHG